MSAGASRRPAAQHSTSVGWSTLEDALLEIADQAVFAPEPGIQIAVADAAGVRVSVSRGIAHPDGTPLSASTIVPIFSATKGVVSTAALVQVSRGLLDLDAAVSDYWPAFGVHGKAGATVLDALAHRLGIPQVPPISLEETLDWQTAAAAVAELEPLWEPGSASGYHPNTWGWVVGELVQRTDPRGRPLSGFIREEITEPLGIDTLWLGVPERYLDDVSALFDDPNVAPHRPEPVLANLPPVVPTFFFPVSEFYARAEVMQAGLPGGGAFANAEGLAMLYAMLANGGVCRGVRILEPEAAALAHRVVVDDVDVVRGVPTRRSAGFVARHPQATDATAAMRWMESAFGFAGGGTVAWGDPERGIGVAVVRNRIVASEDPAESVACAVGRLTGLLRTPRARRR